MIYVVAIVVLTGIALWGIKNLAFGHLADDIEVHDLKDSEVRQHDGEVES